MTHAPRACKSLLGALLACCATIAYAASPTPQMQKAVRAATFEVVIPKVNPDPLTYEKPLPLDLIPFVIRNDAYWSIGTAFAVAPDTYLSAAHVIIPGLSDQFGPMALRDSAGHVYPIDRIVGFSAHEDFVAFTVSGAPPAVPLGTSAEHSVDAPVFAVGNALGEGVVIRDGLLTSETPEEQDGRWKWLRFSAAASPGNSGGPLLDGDGRVIGIVLMKSANENLNYALPVDRALAGIGKPGSADLRYSIKLPVTRASEVSKLKAEFRLPAKFGDFARAYQDVIVHQAIADDGQLTKAQAATLFPLGKSAKLLATVYDSLDPSFVQEQSDETWDATSASNLQTRTLEPRGIVTTGTDLGVSTFRLRRPGGASDDAFYRDGRASMDLLLKGLKLSRQVGPQAIRVTSLGAPRRELLHTDAYGRRWQVRVWPVAYMDATVVAFELPVPEGYLGFVAQGAGSQVNTQIEALKELTNFFYATYSGTPAQWAAFLARRDLRPPAFDRISIGINPGKNLSYRSTRLAMDVQRDVLTPTDETTIDLQMSYFQDHGKVVWDVGAVVFWQDELRHTYASAYRRAQPVHGIDAKMDDEWQKMRMRAPGYNGLAGHDTEYQKYWVRDVISAPNAASPGFDPGALVFYEIACGTEAARFPHELEESFGLLRGSTQVLER